MNLFNRFLVVATFFLIIAGGLVTSTDSGLAVPDWPKSYGMWMPPMVGGIFYEHGHRMVAATVGFLTVIFAVWLWLKESRKWIRVLGTIALLAVIAQGVLGGITVLYLLPTPVSVMHATLAQSFFCLVVSLALFTSKEWKTEQRKIRTQGNPRRLFLATTAVICGQLILGAWVRHGKAALAIPDFPLAFGRLIPPFATQEVAIQFAHRIGAVIVFYMISWTVFVVFRSYRSERRLLRPSILMFALVFVQFALGAFTIWTQTAVPVATAHVATGALILATSVVLTLRSYRIFDVERNAVLVMTPSEAGSRI